MAVGLLFTPCPLRSSGMFRHGIEGNDLASHDSDIPGSSIAQQDVVFGSVKRVLRDLDKPDVPERAHDVAVGWIEKG